MQDGPTGFVAVRQDGAEMILRADVAACLVAAGLTDPESLRGAARAEYRGRGRPFGIDVAGVGPVFVRPYLHGGALGRITGDRFATDARFEAELAANVDAAAAGVPVCEVFGVVSRAAALGMRRGWILLREIRGARDLLETLCARSVADAVCRADCRELLAAAGRAIRSLHDAGFDHPDLHLKNLLVAGRSVLVLDLDGVRGRGALARERRIAGLFRFDRYAAKQAAAGHPITRTDRLRVLRAYAAADWPARADLRALAGRLRAHIDRHVPVRTRAAAVGL